MVARRRRMSGVKNKKESDVLLDPQNFSGPTVLIRGFVKNPKKIIQDAEKLIFKYAKNINNKSS